nr:nucleotide-binding protein [Spirosomataceae bacterium]
ELITRFYRWNLIKSDPDDNPFVDVAIASGAYAVVTFDRHFKVLKSIPFPKVQVITLDEFMAVLSNI